MSQTQELIGQTARKILRAFDSRRGLATDDETALARDLWQTLEETGLALAAVPEALGGAGGSLAEAMAILREAGRHAAPVPLAETTLAGWALGHSGAEVPSGPLTIAPVEINETIQLRRAEGGWSLTGTARRVSWASQAERVAVIADRDGEQVVAMVQPSDCNITHGKNLAGEPRDDVCFDGVMLADSEVVSAAPEVNLVELQHMGALMRSVQIAGALETILEMTVEYAQQRVQFGRPIARFQAVAQQIAVLTGEVAAAGRAAADAVAAVENGDLSRAVAVAKSRIGEAAGTCSEISHQVHGAIGFTHEYALHRFTRRLWSWRDEFGTEMYWQAELGKRIAGLNAPDLWAFLSES